MAGGVTITAVMTEKVLFDARFTRNVDIVYIRVDIVDVFGVSIPGFALRIPRGFSPSPGKSLFTYQLVNRDDRSIPRGAVVLRSRDAGSLTVVK